MKIKMMCSVCGTSQLSESHYNSLEEFYAIETDNVGLSHDNDCGGTMEYTLESTVEEDAAVAKWGFDSVETMVKWGTCTHDELMTAVGVCDCSTEECQQIVDFWHSEDNIYR